MDDENVGFLMNKNHHHNSGSLLRNTLHKVRQHTVRPLLTDCHNSYNRPEGYTRSFHPMDSIYTFL